MGCVTVVGAGLRRQEQRERGGTGEAVGAVKIYAQNCLQAPAE